MTTNIKKILQIGATCIFFLFIIAYAFSRSENLIFGVKVKNVNIIDGATAKNSIMEVTGNAENAINLTLNGREITIDEKGNFKETIALLTGYNMINIKVKDKFGHIDEKNYQIIY